MLATSSPSSKISLIWERGLPSRGFCEMSEKSKRTDKCATLFLTKNVNPKIVSEMLGHASIAITLDTYSHVLPNMQDSAAKAMEDALS